MNCLVGDISTDWGNIRVIFGVYGGYMGVMEKKMETTGIVGVILGLYWESGKGTIIASLRRAHIGTAFVIHPSHSLLTICKNKNYLNPKSR